MTIVGLWEKLNPAVQKSSPQKLGLVAGFVANRKGVGPLRVGIDASVWLSECPDNSATLGNGSALEKLFDQLCALLRLAVTAVFVFPRADSPEFKRGNKVKISHPLTNQFQALINAFGFHCHDAPG